MSSSTTPTNKKKKEAMTTSNFCATYMEKIKEVKQLLVMIDANEDIEKKLNQLDTKNAKGLRLS